MSPARAITSLVLALVMVTGVTLFVSGTLLGPPGEPRLALAGDHLHLAPAASSASSTTKGPPGEPDVNPTWLAQVGGLTGIPLPALRAYARVQLARDSGCEVGWTTLAGIGWVESHHGTIGGRTLDDAARPSSPILGPALDGRGRIAAIPAAPDSLRYHGDRRWEHAVGPMQFLPSSWRAFGTDGDGDGTADPQDLDDAAAAAGRYLCADGHDLSTGPGWQAAVLSYNHATEYVDAVRDAAVSYATAAGG